MAAVRTYVVETTVATFGIRSFKICVVVEIFEKCVTCDKPFFRKVDNNVEMSEVR